MKRMSFAVNNRPCHAPRNLPVPTILTLLASMMIFAILLCATAAAPVAADAAIAA